MAASRIEYISSSSELIAGRRGVFKVDSDSGKSSLVERPPARLQSALIPILMYHHVQLLPPSQRDPIAVGLTLPPAQFEQQLKYLRERGFTSVSMDQVSRYLQGRGVVPDRPVVFTFDDGYTDNFVFAFPLLRKYGYSGTFYAITGLVGGPDYMTWTQLGQLSHSGMEIGSHTITHPDLARWLTPGQRTKELQQSRDLLEAKLGVSIHNLSYPSGSYDAATIAASRDAGYATAVTTEYGAVLDGRKPLELPRIRVQGTDSMETFRWRVEQYYPLGGLAVR